ncbi:MAG: NUDIX hydrolase [Cellvibrio sp.]
MTFAPHVTVATIVEDDGRFLMVYENADGARVFNQPAGHLEANETLREAAIRETLEETGWEVELTGAVGVHLYTAPRNQVTYCRVTFIARPIKHHPDLPLDEGIIGPQWLTIDELRQRKDELRSPMTLQIVEQYLNGARYPLDVIAG